MFLTNGDQIDTVHHLSRQLRPRNGDHELDICEHELSSCHVHKHPQSVHHARVGHRGQKSALKHCMLLHDWSNMCAAS